MDFDRYDHIRPIRWHGRQLQLLDQRKLPFAVEYLDCRSSREVSQAIRDLVVRGAPAIGIAAAFGVVLAARWRRGRDGRRGAGRRCSPASPSSTPRGRPRST